MLVVQCKDCRKEITSSAGRSESCGCPNMMTVKGDSVTAVDLTRVVMVSSNHNIKNKPGVLSDSDLMFQEERRKRKVRKMDFEVR
jgi:hypothetical protein